MKKVTLAGMSLLLAACATSHVLVGTQRAPISPDQVKVYLEPPQHFERVALLESTSAGSMAFTAQQKTNKVLTRLKKEAAELGANGILLEGMGNTYAGSVGTFNGSTYGGGVTGVGYSAPVMVKSGNAIAIYVTP